MSSEERLEREHVHRVYDTIADHFSRTRHSEWPRVTAFLAGLADGSLVLDVGCGNGKYMSCARLAMIGCDRSANLLSICRQRGHWVVGGDALELPFRRNSFDAVISIAVLHHLSSRERRLRALEQLVSCLRSGGRALVYVWALEQKAADGQRAHYCTKSAANGDQKRVLVEERELCLHSNRTPFQGQEVLVPWKGASGEHLRYYHVFASGELECLAKEVKSALTIESWFESGNHCLVLEKK